MNHGGRLNPESYFGRLEARFGASKYSIERNVDMAGRTIDFFAMKSSWELTKVGKITRFVLGVSLGEPNIAEIKEFSKSITKYVLENWKKERRTGFVSKSVLSVPLVVSRKFDADIIERLRTATTEKYWLAFEFPVLFGLELGQAYYSNATPTWGRLYYKGFRKFAERMFTVGNTDPHSSPGKSESNLGTGA